MSKILGLDIGDEWVGTALSDPSGIIAKPFKTTNRTEFEKFLKDVIEDEQIELVIVGFPKTMTGKISQQTQKVIDLHKELVQKFPEITFILWDERLSSKRADVIKTKDKKQSHSIAAAFILDSYLGYLAHQKNLSSIED